MRTTKMEASEFIGPCPYCKKMSVQDAINEHWFCEHCGKEFQGDCGI